MLNKIGIIGAVIGGIVGIGGLVIGIIADPLIGGIIALVFIVTFGSVGIFFLKPFLVNRGLMKNGKDAIATVINIWDTGVTINMDPQIGLNLEVKPTDGSPSFQSKATLLISRLDTFNYQPGMTFNVKYNPNNTKKVAIIRGGIGASAMQGMDKDQATKMLMETDKRNREIVASGEAAKAIVLSYKDLNIFVNGNNPFVELELQVIPEGKESFKATARAPILSSSVSKYQPGQEINIKYDPDDLTRISLFHS